MYANTLNRGISVHNDFLRQPVLHVQDQTNDNSLRPCSLKHAERSAMVAEVSLNI